MFLVWKRKSEHHHWILHIQISLNIMFQLKLTIFIFWTKFVQKGCFLLKNRKSEHHHWFLHIWISLDTKFQLKLKIYPKRVLSVKNGKSEHHHSILHIRISLGTKFQLKLTILIFWTKFAEKGFSSQKQKK